MIFLFEILAKKLSNLIIIQTSNVAQEVFVADFMESEKNDNAALRKLFFLESFAAKVCIVST